MGMIELAFIRNELYNRRVTNEYLSTLENVKKIVARNGNPYEGLIILCIDLSIESIGKNELLQAAEEINFIHNFPVEGDFTSWDSKHFFNIELLDYIEKNEDVCKMKNIIKQIAKFC